jgi:hypothetical protein
MILFILGVFCLALAFIVFGMPIAVIVEGVKMIISGECVSICEDAFVSAVFSAIILFIAWFMCAVNVPEMISPSPMEFYRHSDAELYNKRLAEHKKAARKCWPISLAVLAALAIMSYFAVASVLAGNVIAAAVIMIVLSVITIASIVVAAITAINVAY